MPSRFLTVEDAKRLRALLTASHEYVGRVDVKKDGRMIFDHSHRRSPGSGLTFHTHNRSACNGGFDPPSRQDLRHLCKWAKTGHFVVSHNGIYYIRISCHVPKKKVDAICAHVTRLQDRMRPGAVYNAEWLRAVNSLYPGCLRVKFISWSKLL